MKKRLLKKMIVIATFFVAITMTAQQGPTLYNFTGGAQSWLKGYGIGTVEHDPTGGATGDGALTLERLANGNANIRRGQGGDDTFIVLDRAVYNYIKIVYKNETKGTELKLLGLSRDAGTSGEGVAFGNISILNLESESSVFETVYIDISSIPAGQEITRLDMQVRRNPSDAAGTKMIFDEIEFVSLPATFKGILQNAGFDDLPAAIGTSPWSPANQTFATVNTSTVEAHDGTQSMAHTYSSVPDATHFVFNDFIFDFGASRTKSATITLWVKVVRPGSPGVSPLVSLQGQFRTGTTTVVSELDTKGSNVTTTKTDGSWEQLTFSLTPDAAYSTAQFRYGIIQDNLLAGDIVYIDDISNFDTSVASVGGTWENSASWGGTPPVQGEAKVIDSNIEITSAIISDGPITINGANTLTITTGNSLTLNSDITTGGNLILQPGAQLIVTGNATGNASFTRTLPAANGADAQLDGWFSMTAPFSGGDLNTTWAGEATNNIATSGDTNKRGIAWYAEASDDWTYLLSNNSNATTFQAGRGYIVKQTTPGIITFTGTINTNDSGVAVPVTNTGSGFNLLGNPYSALINADTFITANMADLTAQEIWVWNDNGNVYNSKVNGLGANFKLAPGQAFFVQANKATDLEFAKSNQEIGGDTFQKSAQTKITLNISNESSHRYAEIYYIDNASKGYENGFEGRVFKGVSSNLSLYTNIIENNVGEAYQIQSLPNSDFETMVVPVGVKAAAGKELTFTAEALNLPSDIKVFLEDRQLGVFTQLDAANAQYKVTLTEAANGVGRFYIHTSANSTLSTDNVAALQGVSIFKANNSTLKIAGLQQGKASVSLFNIQGKQILTSAFEANGVKEIALPKLATGVYLVQLTTETGKLNKKIILE